MKGKLNFDLKAIQSFLLAHVEKFGFVVVVVCLLLLISGAVGREGYEREPTDFTEIAQDAEEHIESTPPPEQTYTGTPIAEKAEHIRDPIENLYDLPHLWTPFVWEQLDKRGEPKVYTVRDLEGESGHGGIRVRAGATTRVRTGSVTGQRWIVLTGLIPYEEQVEAYEEAFGDAKFQDANRDTPSIVYYRVERAVFDSPDDTDEPNWEQLHIGNRMAEVREFWNGTIGEVVTGKYIHTGGTTPIAMPLPPLESKTFGREVAHHPEIPLAIEEASQAPAKGEPVEEPKADEKPPADLPQDIPPEARGRETVVQEVVREEEKVPYRLFRFFDMHVQPGKHYRYRVKLMLDNPNYDLGVQYLAEESFREERWLVTEWSEPTGLISVPRDARVLLGSVKPPPGGRVTREPKATVGIPYFFYEAGAELYKQYEVLRGKHLNFPGNEIPEHLVPAGFGDAAASGDEKGAGPPKVSFNTENVLLDMIGGERLPGGDRDLTRPGRILLLDPEGRLVVRNELEDLSSFNRFEGRPDKPAGRARPGRGSAEDDEAMDDMDELFTEDPAEMEEDPEP